MAVIQEKKMGKIRSRWSCITKISKAAIVLVLAFFIVCACTIGGFNSPGEAYFASDGTTIAFYLDYNQDDAGKTVKLNEVYVNVGAIYAPVGSDVKLTFKKATGSSSTVSWSTTNLGSVTFGNIYSSSGNGVSGANYNWVKVFDYTDKADSDRISISYKLIQLQTACDMLINEIVFVDENGDVIPVCVTESAAKENFSESLWLSTYRDVFRQNEKTGINGKYGDPQRLVDRQINYSRGSSVYSNFTQDEMYTLTQIDNILLGSRNLEGTYVADTDGGPFAVLLPLLATLIFGKSVFGLRIVPVLFTAALVGLVYLFAKRLFKSEGFGLFTAALFAGGGLALTVGRLGLLYSQAAFLLLASYYFMYKFFDGGISSEKPLKSAAGSILASGLAFAFAFATDPKTVISALGVVVLFVLGAVRQGKAHRAEARSIRKEMSDKNAVETSERVMRDNIEQCESKERALRAGYSYKNKLTVLFFLISFIVGTFALTVFAAIPSYFSYVKLYELDPENPTVGIFQLVGKALGDAFSLGNLTAYSAGNASSAFGWFISLKGATLFSSSADTVYCALNAQLNIAMAITALVGVVFMTVYAVLYAVTGGKNGAYATEYSPRILSAYFVLMLGLITSLFAFAFLGGVSAVQSFLFDVFYIAFIPLMFYTAYVHDGGEKKPVLGLPMNSALKAAAALCVLYALIFVLTLPMVFCIPVPPLLATVCFGWTSFLNNGFYRI